MEDVVTQFVKQKAGSHLRAVGRYEQTDTTLLHCRDDLDKKRVTNRLTTIHENITWDWNPNDGEIADIGRKEATLQIREEAILIHLLEADESGYLIGLEPEAASNLTTFLDQCLEQLDTH